MKYVNLFINYWKRGYALKRAINNHNIDIIYTFLFDASIVGIVAKIFTGVKQVSSVRFGSNHYYKRPITIKKIIEYLLYIMIYNSSNKIIANSVSGKLTLIKDMKITSKKIVVIHNGKPLFNKKNPTQSYIKKHSNEEIIIGFVGRLNKIKNPHMAIDAVSYLTTYYNINLIILGNEDGITIKELEDYAKDNKVKLQCLGNVNDLEHYYNIFDVLISSSTSIEGCSNVILEALSVGLPVVASDVGDNKLLLANKRGLIVASNDFNLFAKSLEYYIKNEDKMQGKRIQYIKNNFSVKKMIDKTRSILIQI